MTANISPLPQLTPRDFASDQEVRWCPGCGDYSILAQVRKTLATVKSRRENTVFVSGIGCSSRFPYYVSTYGFHSIHGRAPTIATGIKIANPELDVWIVTGDGDGLSIGGNHLLHVLRRNVGVKILLFNNRIYGLTKGQFSPTSEHGKKTKSSPMGTIEIPVSPLSVALGAEATFVARSVDVDKSLPAVLERAANHNGAAFVEIYQDCNVFNHDAFAYATDKETKEDHLLYLEHGKPMIFGKNRDKGIILRNHKPEVVKLASPENPAGAQPDDLLFHDEQDENIAFLLSRMSQPEFPEPLGVFYATKDDTFEDLLTRQVTDAITAKGQGTIHTLLHSGETYEVKG